MDTNKKNISVLVVNIIFMIALIYMWYFWTGYIKPPKGGLHWHFILAVSGTIFGLWSISKYKLEWTHRKTKVGLLNIILPAGFIGFHAFWVLRVIFNLLTK